MPDTNVVELLPIITMGDEKDPRDVSAHMKGYNSHIIPQPPPINNA